jgi:hypothetical protein
LPVSARSRSAELVSLQRQAWHGAICTAVHDSRCEAGGTAGLGSDT